MFRPEIVVQVRLILCGIFHPPAAAQIAAESIKRRPLIFARLRLLVERILLVDATRDGAVLGVELVCVFGVKKSA